MTASHPALLTLEPHQHELLVLQTMHNAYAGCYVGDCPADTPGRNRLTTAQPSSQTDAANSICMARLEPFLRQQRSHGHDYKQCSWKSVNSQLTLAALATCFTYCTALLLSQPPGTAAPSP
eukprot:GHRQ01022878.1.p1 GENE.GHRQ01022878.1~~GHRQ01022878.1.p1  ORF type:complete len:121 (+),score=12.05 GHRQ01022878.1:455-817(+)